MRVNRLHRVEIIISECKFRDPSVTDVFAADSDELDYAEQLSLGGFSCYHISLMALLLLRCSSAGGDYSHMGSITVPDSALILAVLLILDAIVYGFGSALRASHPVTDEEEKEESFEEGSLAAREYKRRIRRKKILDKVLKDQSDYVDTVQLVTACVNMVVGAVYGIALAGFLQDRLTRGMAAGMTAILMRILAFVLAWLLVLFFILVFGVQIPKRLGSARPEKWIERGGTAFHVLMLITLPLTRLVNLTARGCLYLFGIRGNPLEGDVTEEEIRSMLNEGHEQGVIDQSEAEMITNIFEFSDKEACDIMTHRKDMIALDGDIALSEALAQMLRLHNSRFPVYRENIDDIIGILHFRDAVRIREENPKAGEQPIQSIEGLLREADFVPETKDIDDLFRQMQKKKTQMVIVIDEYGQTAGLIAMEDILEEIVGNIMDEYDVDENHITPTGNKNEFILDGRTPLRDLTERFGIVFDDDRFETVNGFLMGQMDKIPEACDHFTTDYGGFRFHVLSVADRQAQRILLTKIQTAR